jgi:hypothetical protein
MGLKVAIPMFRFLRPPDAAETVLAKSICIGGNFDFFDGEVLRSLDGETLRSEAGDLSELDAREGDLSRGDVGG